SRRTFSVPLLIRATALVSHATLFLNDTAPTETYTLSLHDALPISARVEVRDEVVEGVVLGLAVDEDDRELGEVLDRSRRDAVRVARARERDELPALLDGEDDFLVAHGRGIDLDGEGRGLEEGEPVGAEVIDARNRRRGRGADGERDVGVLGERASRDVERGRTCRIRDAAALRGGDAL